MDNYTDDAPTLMEKVGAVVIPIGILLAGSEPLYLIALLAGLTGLVTLFALCKRQSVADGEQGDDEGFTATGGGVAWVKPREQQDT